MNERELKTLLGQTKNERRGGTPHDVWINRNREILLMQVRNTTDANAKTSFVAAARHLVSVFVPQETVMGMARAMGVFVLVTGTVLAGGLASAQVYKDSVPGELLYNMKLAVESAQLLLAPNDDYRTRLHGEFADHRLDEVAALAEGSSEGHEKIDDTLIAFDGEVRALSSGLDRLTTADPEGVVEVAKLLERKMTVYQNVLRNASAALSPALRSRIAASSDLVDGVSVQSIAVIVEKHLAGNANVPAAVVVSKVEERLKIVEDKVDAAPSKNVAAAENKSKAKAAIAEAKILLEDNQYQAALSKIAEVAVFAKEAEEEEAAAAENEPVTEPGAEGEEEPATETEPSTETTEPEPSSTTEEEKPAAEGEVKGETDTTTPEPATPAVP